jgi:hypothetical protein
LVVDGLRKGGGSSGGRGLVYFSKELISSRDRPCCKFELKEIAADLFKEITTIRSEAGIHAYSLYSF